MVPRPRRSAAWVACAAVILAGCGGADERDVALAKGKVVCQGKPVSGGTVTLTPVSASRENELPGKPATAAVQSDGTFVLSTYGDKDGAIVGKHRVMYTPPEGLEEPNNPPQVEEGSPEEARLNAERARRERELLRNPCVLNEEKTVEIKAGEENQFTIDLVPAASVSQSEESESEE